MRLKYVGTKSRMPIYTPLGKVPTVKSKIHCVMTPGESVELLPSEIIAMVKLDPINFAILEGEAEELEPCAVELQPEEDIIDTETSKPKRKRRTKLEMMAARGEI
jgi:hypothetical protein